MCNNRIVSLFYRTILVTLSFIGVFLSTKLLEGTFNTDMFIYYTSLSNILCLVFLIILVVHNLKQVLKGETKGHYDGFIRFKGACTMAITVTFLVYAFLLAPTEQPQHIFTLQNLLVHYIVPLLILLDFFIFDEKKKVKVLDPIIWVAIPYIYLAYALIRSVIVGPNGHVQYPYFFINVAEYGVGGVALWVLGLTAFFVVLGYFMYFVNHLVKENGKIKFSK